MASRSADKANKAISEIRRQLQERNKTIGEDQVVPLVLDLSKLRSIVNAADEFKRKESQLDILGRYESIALNMCGRWPNCPLPVVNNAGPTVVQDAENGWEMLIGIR